MNNFIFLRGLRFVDYSVFCVEKGQKTYYDPIFNKYIAYSSGQQVKRSMTEYILNELNEQFAPISFFWKVTTTGKLNQSEVYSPCNPNFTDQLLGGWMMAKSKKKSVKDKDEESIEKDENTMTIKRRSPFSISALRPLHPLMSSVNEENISFDRSDKPDDHTVIVRDAKGKILSDSELEKLLNDTNHIPLSPRKWIPSDNGSNSRAHGLYIYDVAIDLRTLFCVSINQKEPELESKTIELLIGNGWNETRNIFGKCLVCPKERREKIIEAVASGLINWRITSNQSRTFSLMETLAISISDNANKLAASIRAELNEERERSAKPVIDKNTGADVYVTLPCSGYIAGAGGELNALENAETKLKELMLAYDYENQ